MFHHGCSNPRWRAMPKPVRIVGYAIMGLVIAGSVAVLFGYVTMALWNAIVPEISSLPALTFWQAVGLLLLARLFTGRFSHGHHRCHFRRKFRGPSVEHYADWWESEGEAAFMDYHRRTERKTTSEDPHER
jgi:hypothetical protein